MPGKLPYVRFFMSDWLSATRGMKANEIGVYFTLLALMYERGEPLPEDYTRLSRQCGCTPKTCESIVSVLMGEGKVYRTEAGLWNKRVQKEFDFRGEKSEVAFKAAEKRWEKPNKNNGYGMQEHSERNADAMPNPEARSQIDKREASASPKKGNRIPSDWQPSEVDRQFAAGLGMTSQAIDFEADKFRDFWISKTGAGATKQDWAATWRNWTRNAKSTGPPLPKPKSAFQQHQDECAAELDKVINRNRGNEEFTDNVVDLGTADYRRNGKAAADW